MSNRTVPNGGLGAFPYTPNDAAIAIEIADAALTLAGLPTYTEAINAINGLLCTPSGPLSETASGFLFVAEACRVANGSKS